MTKFIVIDESEHAGTFNRPWAKWTVLEFPTRLAAEEYALAQAREKRKDVTVYELRELTTFNVRVDVQATHPQGAQV